MYQISHCTYNVYAYVNVYVCSFVFHSTLRICPNSLSLQNLKVSVYSVNNFLNDIYLKNTFKLLRYDR